VAPKKRDRIRLIEEGRISVGGGDNHQKLLSDDDLGVAIPLIVRCRTGGGLHRIVEP
jgi:hypothetical protein